MSAQHKPGPWIWQHWPDGVDAIAEASTLGTVATIFPGAEDSAAKARLIAAAPDLLEAVRLFMALDPTFELSSDRHLAAIIAAGRPSAPMALAVHAARAAIIKATGSAA